MKVVILCGGQGARLREETEYKPKPMVPIGGKPILWHIMKHYEHYGFNEFILCLGYKGDVIRDYFLDYAKHETDIVVDLAKNRHMPAAGCQELPDWRITLAETGENTMTGGRLRRVSKYLDDEPFLMTYGDAVCSVPLDELVAFHRERGCLATITGVPPLPHFGELDVEEDRVVRFNEKPQRQHGIINGGYFVLESEVLSYVEDDETVFERSPLERLARDDQLALFRHTGFWQCMDTYRDFKHLNELWDAGRHPWVMWDESS